MIDDKVFMIERISEKILQETSQNNLFFLWGMPASGKSTIGKRLSAKLDYIFIDLDEYISSQENKTILEIFQQKGVAYFRMLETQYLNGIIKNNFEQKTIIATGGGTPCFNENDLKMLKNGFCIFLNIDLMTLMKRLENDTENMRPLFADKDNEKLKKLVENLYQNRIEYYEKAHFRIDF